MSDLPPASVIAPRRTEDDLSGEYEAYRERSALTRAEQEFAGENLEDILARLRKGPLTGTRENVAQMSGAPRTTPGEDAASLGRQVVGAAIDLPRSVVGGLLETPERIASMLDDVARVIPFGPGPALLTAAQVAEQLGSSLEAEVGRIVPDVGESRTLAGKIARDIAPFLVAFGPLAGTLQGAVSSLGLASRAPRAAKLAADAAAGGMADFATLDKSHGSLLSLLGEYADLREPALEMLEAPDETPPEGMDALQRRFALAAEGVGLGVVAATLGKGIRVLRSANAVRREARAGGREGVRDAGVTGVPEAEASLGTSDDLLSRVVEDVEAGVLTPGGAAVKGPDGKFMSPRTAAELETKLGDVERRLEEVLPDARTSADDPMIPELAEVAERARQLYSPIELRRRLGKPINWERMDSPEAIRTTLDDLMAAFSDDVAEARRGVRGEDATRAAADLLGMTPAKLLQRRKGQAFNAEEVLAARTLLATAGLQLDTLGRAAARTDDAVAQYKFRRFLTTYKAIADEVAGVRAESGRALQAWKIQAGGDLERANAIEHLMAEAGGGGSTRQLAAQVTRLFETGAQPEQVVRQVERAWSLRASDAFAEHFTAGLLWDPTTHIVNTTSPYFVAAQLIAERETAGQLGRFSMRRFGSGTGDSLFAEGGELGRVVPGEGLAMARGLAAAVSDMQAAAMAGARAESGVVGRIRGATQGITGLREGAGIADATKIDPGRMNKITSDLLVPEFAKPAMERSGLSYVIDLYGKLARKPFEGLGFEDDMGKIVLHRAELHALSYRMATREWEQAGRSWTKEEFAGRVSEILQDPPESLRVAAQDAASYGTFTQQGGDVTKAFQTLSRIPIAGPMVMPYVRTPGNMLKYSLERTPLAPLMSHVRADIAQGGAKRDVAMARIALGSTMLFSFMDASDSGYVTGSMKSLSPGDRETLLRNGIKPNSVIIDGKSFELNRIDNVGSFVTLGGNLGELIRTYDMDDEDLDRFGEVVAATAVAHYDVAMSKTWLLGLARLNDAFRYGENSLINYVNGQISAAVPFSSALRKAREVTAELATEEGATLPDISSPGDAVLSMIPGLEQRLTRKRDLWGNPIGASSVYGPIWDTFVPVRATEVAGDPIDQHMKELGVGVSRMRKKGQEFRGVPVDFHDFPRTYELYEQLAGGGEDIDPTLMEDARFFNGRTTHERLNDLVTGFDPLSSRYLDAHNVTGKPLFITEIIGRGRALAREKLLDPSFLPNHEELNRFRDYVQSRRDAIRLDQQNPAQFQLPEGLP